MDGGVEDGNLLFHRQRAAERFCLSTSTMRSPCARRALVSASRSEPNWAKALQLAVLGVDQLQRAGDLLHGLDLGVAADTGDRDTGVDGRADAGVEQLGLQEDLAVGDGDDVGRDVGGNVARLRLDDGQSGQEPPPSSSESLARAPADGSAGRKRRRGKPRVPEDGAAAAKCTVGHSVLGQVVVDDQHVLALCMKYSPMAQPA